MKKAFTLIELIFVIVVIGVLSVAGINIFINIYESYFESRTHNEIQMHTQLALDKIAARLAYRIKPSVIISWGNANLYTSLESANAATVGTNNYRLEWIAYDNDSFRGMATNVNDPYIIPGYSGFIDLDNPLTSGTSLHTPGGDLSGAEAIMDSLSDGDINLTAPVTSVAVMIFPDAPGSVDQYGWFNSGDTNLTHTIRRFDNQTLRPVLGDFRGINNEVYENYTLAFSAYALEYNQTSRNINLYYNYQPWEGETFRDGNSTLFLENVSNFIFTQVGTILKIQLCMNRSDYDANISDEQYSLCKERAIF